MPLQLFKCNHQIKMNTISQIFQPRGLFLWSFIFSESFLLPVAGCDAATDQSSTRVIEKHKQCGFALAVVDHHSNVPYFHHVDSSEECMGNFLRMLHSLARDIHERKKQFPLYKGNRRNLDKNSATHCWICEEPFDSKLDPEERA